MSDLHIGKMIKEVFTQRKMSISDFAKAIHSSRTNIYDIFLRESIDVDLLIRISEVLDYDFLRVIYNKVYPTNQLQSAEHLYVAKEVTLDELSELKKMNERMIVFTTIEE